MLGLVILLATLLLVALALHACAKEFGGSEVTFWHTVAALGVAKFASRALKYLPVDIFPRLALGLVVYAVVLTLFLRLMGKVPWGRSILMGIGAAVLVFAASLAAMYFLPPSNSSTSP
jgi:hypothetical protein